MSSQHPEQQAEQAADQLPATPDAAQPERPITRTGMFGAKTTGDTSGYGRLVVRRAAQVSSPRPFGDPNGAGEPGWFDEVHDELERAFPEFGDAIERVVVDRGELTFHVRRAFLPQAAQTLRDDLKLRFELCTGVSGVHYPQETGAELRAVYHFLSMTHNRRIRFEVSCPDEDPHIPSIVSIYPTNDWHERETYDFFGIVFDGHPALTRIQMPDDWVGHPQRKDYPLGGIPVEYRGAEVPPPDERRTYV
ncbi:NADH-quinone oxidoreductase subunit C [Actinomadura scrupuli]|uniref:NADH-quinone oxidoreductase subunit C n=1 Tax=Actinomadura scrupuli TaxID=559629 RepID=UPI003D982D30